jgi:hypothetical protein
MKRINQMQRRIASFFRLRQSPSCGARLACEADLSGRQRRAWASSDRLSVGKKAPVFCGLGLEVFARPVISYKTVLPKAVRTAGIMMPGSNLGAASAGFPPCAATISLERRVVSKQ